MIKALIVEDEIDARSLLSCIINDYCVGVELIGTADCIKSAVKQIEENKPDILFLDIELNGETSFDLLDKINYQDFKIIFTTAYDHYAIKAFRYEAIDYILKPYSPKDVLKAVDRVKRNQYDESVNKRLNQLVNDLSVPNYNANEKISLSTSEGVSIIKVNEIVRLEADRVYTTIYLSNGIKHVASKVLKKFEELLSINKFLRVHSGHLINKDFINKYVSEDGGYVVMTDGAQVPVARRRKHEFLAQICFS